MNINEVLATDEQELLSSLLQQINQEKELIHLMKSQISSNPCRTLAYTGSKLEGLKSKSLYLRKFLQFAFEFPHSHSFTEDFNTFCSISLENSASLDLDPNSAKIIFHDQPFFEEIDAEIHKLNMRLSTKDAKISKLKQTLSNCFHEREEMITQQEEEINILKHQIEIYKHHITNMRGQIQHLGSQITEHEIDYEKLVQDMHEFGEMFKNSEAEVLTLMKKLNESEETVKGYEKLLDSAKSPSLSQAEAGDNISAVQKLKISIAKLEDELFRQKEKAILQQCSLESKYNNLYNLYQKLLTEKYKLSDTIYDLNEEINNFNRSYWNAKIMLWIRRLSSKTIIWPGFLSFAWRNTNSRRDLRT